MRFAGLPEGYNTVRIGVPPGSPLLTDKRIEGFLSVRGELPHTCLSELNDNGFTFAEIADLIERHL